MASKFRLFSKRFFIYTNIAVVLFFLLACLAPYLNPVKWWFISFLGLAFPFLLVIVVSFLITWLLIKPRFAWISLIALILSYPSTSVFFAFNPTGSFKYNNKTPGTIRVVSWNVARFIEMKRNNNAGSQSRLKMLELIQEQNADVLCVQEFFHSFDSTYYPNIDHISKQFNYPYWFYSHDIDGDNHYTGSIIFSRDCFLLRTSQFATHCFVPRRSKDARSGWGCCR